MIELEESRISEIVITDEQESARSTAIDAFYNSLGRNIDRDNHFQPNDEGNWSSLILRHDSISIAGSLILKSHDWLFISTFWVKPSFRHLNAGTRLLSMVESIARNDAAIGLYLTTADMYSHDFYAKHGFEVTGVIKDNPTKGFTLFLMQKRLG